MQEAMQPSAYEAMRFNRYVVPGFFVKKFSAIIVFTFYLNRQSNNLQKQPT